MDLVGMLVLAIIAILGFVWALRAMSPTGPAVSFAKLIAGSKLIGGVVLLVLVVGSILWVLGGRKWVNDKLGQMTRNAIVFPTPTDLPELRAGVSASDQALRVCNHGDTGWKDGMIQINDKYVSKLQPVEAGECVDIKLSAFTVKNWKRVPAGSPYVYKIQIYVSAPTPSYGQFPILSSQIERLANPTRPECVPVAINRPFVDWRSVPFPNSGTVSSPDVAYVITEDGRVLDVVSTQSGGSRAIDEVVRSTIGQWRYRAAPGCGDRQVSVQMEVDPDAMRKESSSHNPGVSRTS